MDGRKGRRLAGFEGRRDRRGGEGRAFGFQESRLRNKSVAQISASPLRGGGIKVVLWHQGIEDQTWGPSQRV